MIRKILAPLDGSRLAEQALPHVERVALAFKASVVLTWVLPPLHIMSEHGVAVYETLLTQEHVEAERYLQRIETQLREKNIPTSSIILKNQPVAEGIIDLAITQQVDVIIKTTHGRSGISRWLYGSVATKVLQQAPCPVYLIKVKPEDELEDSKVGTRSGLM